MANMRKLTIDQCRELFLYTKQTEGISPKTLKDYTRDTRVFIEETGTGGVAIDEIDKAVVLKWVVAMQQREVNGITINKYLRDVRCFLYWCFDEYNLPAFTIKLLRVQEPAPKAYSPEIIKLLLQKPKRSDYLSYRAYVVIAFMMATGARAGTVVEIKMSDIDLQKGQVSYAHTKNKLSQVVPLTPSICKIIREFSLLWGVDTYLVSKSNGDKMDVRGLEHAIERYFKSLGLENEYKGLHSFRHSFALEYIKSGGGAFQLQQILGHSDLTVTKKYVKLAATDIDISPVPLDKFL